MLCKQQGQNMNLFIGWRVFYGLDSSLFNIQCFHNKFHAKKKDFWLVRVVKSSRNNKQRELKTHKSHQTKRKKLV